MILPCLDDGYEPLSALVLETGLFTELDKMWTEPHVYRTASKDPNNNMAAMVFRGPTVISPNAKPSYYYIWKNNDAERREEAFREGDRGRWFQYIFWCG